MYANTSVAAMYSFSYSQTTSASAQDVDADAFKNIFASSLKNMMSNQAGIQDSLNKLGDNFPGLNFRPGKPGEGLQGTRDFFGNAAGDYAAIDESLLAGMAGNGGLFQQVQDAISSFMNQSGSSEAMSGAYVQTSISVTYTSVRYNVSQFDEQSGDLLTANELTTSLQAKFQELIDRLLNRKGEGKQEIAGGNGGTSAAVEGLIDAVSDQEASTDAVAEVDAAGNAASSSSSPSGSKTQYSGQSLSWSIQMYYSNEYLMSSFGNNANGSTGNANGGGNGGGNGDSLANLANIMNRSTSYYSASGQIDSVSSLSNSLLPQSIYDMFFGGGNNQNAAGGPFTSLLNNGLSGLGMSVDGFQQTQSGFIAQLRESRNSVSDLLNFYANQSKAAISGADAEATVDADAAEAETVAETEEAAVV